MTNATDPKAECLRAKLQWEAACERLGFALSPPAGVDGREAPDLASCLALAQTALDELRDAFQPKPD